MEPHVERMCNESQKLSEGISAVTFRAEKLNEFMDNNPIFAKLSAEAKDLQRVQYYTMVELIEVLKKYRDVVDKRIAYSLNNPTPQPKSPSLEK